MVTQGWCFCKYPLIENYTIIIVLVSISLRKLLVFIPVHHISWKGSNKDGELYSFSLNISDREEIFPLCSSVFVQKEVDWDLWSHSESLHPCSGGRKPSCVFSHLTRSDIWQWVTSEIYRFFPDNWNHICPHLTSLSSQPVTKSICLGLPRNNHDPKVAWWQAVAEQ